MNALVTGATGFVGARLVAALRERGDGVRAFARSLRPAPGDGTHSIPGDVLDGPALAAAAAGVDVVFHCAHGGDAPGDAHRVNVAGTVNVVRAAAASGVPRVVLLSTWRVHGRPLAGDVDEERPLVTRGLPYDVSKADAERAVRQLRAEPGMPEVVTLRPTLVWGPRSEPWLRTPLARIRQGRLRLVGGGTGLANLVHVDDLVRAMLMAADRPGLAGQAFLVSGDAPVPWHDYLLPLARLARRRPPASVPPRLARLVAWTELWRLRATGRPPALTAADVDLFWEHAWARIDKARALLGWAPQVDVATGLRAAAAALAAEGLLPEAAA